MTDSELIDKLGALQGVNLISDDGGRWAVSGDGMQPVPEEGGFTETVHIVSLVDAEDWRPSIREALEAYFAANPDE